MQRLHEGDLSGHLLDKGGWEHLCLPAEVEERTIISLPSGREYIREDGSLLWPEREGTEEIAKTKTALGSYGYAGQYQQRPSPAEGGIFKRRWWKYWHFPGHPLPSVVVNTEDGFIMVDPEPLPDLFDEQIQSWDMAFKGTTTSAYVAGQVWGKRDANKYLLDQIRDKLDFPATVSAVRALTVKWPLTRAKLVEDAANGPAVISSLQREIPGLIPIAPQGSKEARAHAVSPDVEAGNVYLPHPAIYAWVNDYVEELTTFPNSKYKDQCDSTTMALNRLVAALVVAVVPLNIEKESKWRTG